MSQTRRLAAILAADVAGYSRLIGADEGGTLERLKALRRELLDPKIAEHHGRIVKTTGEGMLVEFASVVDAVRCAVEVRPPNFSGRIVNLLPRSEPLESRCSCLSERTATTLNCLRPSATHTVSWVGPLST